MPIRSNRLKGIVPIMYLHFDHIFSTICRLPKSHYIQPVLLSTLQYLQACSRQDVGRRSREFRLGVFVSAARNRRLDITKTHLFLPLHDFVAL